MINPQQATNETRPERSARHPPRLPAPGGHLLFATPLVAAQAGRSITVGLALWVV